MKTLLPILVLPLVAFTSYAQNRDKPSLKALDEKNGFRDARFEADTSAFNDLVFSKAGSKSSRLYVRSGDSKTIGAAEITTIEYGFYKGKLSLVIISTKGISNTTALKDALTAQYGPGDKALPSTSMYIWQGQKVTMNLHEDSANGDGWVYMFCRPLLDQQKKDNEELAKKAASDL